MKALRGELLPLPSPQGCLEGDSPGLPAGYGFLPRALRGAVLIHPSQLAWRRLFPRIIQGMQKACRIVLKLHSRKELCFSYAVGFASTACELRTGSTHVGLNAAASHGLVFLSRGLPCRGGTGWKMVRCLWVEQEWGEGHWGSHGEVGVLGDEPYSLCFACWRRWGW